MVLIKCLHEMETKEYFIILISAFFCFFLIAEVDAGIGSVDFSKVVKGHNVFVDKTLLIKTFLNEDQQDPTVKIVTAPTKFGKSTIVDMLKRFLAIPVDGEGRRVALNTTENYKLFCDNNLTICEDKTFVEQHMGQYPVIHVNYHNLETIDSYVTLLQQLRTVIRITFEEHEYLVRNSALFTGNLTQDLFTRHCSVTGVRSLSDTLVLDAFVWLSRLLCQHFSSQVIVLMDEYDAYANEMLFGKPFEEGEILKFLDGINRKLFNSNNNCVKKALLTGILRVKELGYSLPNTNVKGYRWLDDHEFAQFYGFTTSEVSKLIKNVSKDVYRRQKSIDLLKLYYGGYRVQDTNTTLHNMWSVIKFIVYKLRPANYWCKSSRLNEIEYFIIKDETVINAIKEAVIRTGPPIYGNISKPFNHNDVIGMKKIVDVNNFYVLLYDLGFLSLSQRKRNSGIDHLTPFIIPNVEIKIEFCRLLTKYYVNKFGYDLNNIKILHSNVENFSVRRRNAKVYKQFYRAVNNVITGKNHHLHIDDDFYTSLFVIFASAFPVGIVSKSTGNYSIVDNVPVDLRERVKRIIDKDEKRNGREIIICNADRIAVVIEIVFQKDAIGKVKESLNGMALDAISYIYKNYYHSLSTEPNILFENVKIVPQGKVYVGLAYDLDTSDLSIVFCNPQFDKKITLIEEP